MRSGRSEPSKVLLLREPSLATVAQSQVQSGRLIEHEQSGEATSLRVGLAALQKNLQLLRIKEVLFLLTFIIGAALLRVPFQWMPSVEPLTFFAILAGWMFGGSRGFAVGAGSLYLSNYLVFGGQGPWTIFQALGFGVAGFLGGQLRSEARYWEIGLVTLVATLCFEAIVDVGSLTFFPFALFSLILTALPFSFVHILSNVLFSSVLRPAKKMADRIGGFSEQAITLELIERYKNKLARLGQEKRGS
ncbi:MAG: hypothetical protein GXP63_00325 [DPANN group archaeon]|nr:hypothetical protein [DPANN group archaeon]